MISALLLATAIALPRAHVPVQAAQPVSAVSQEGLRRVDEVRISFFSYCDASQQPTIMLTNVGPTGVLVAWTLTAMAPGHPADVWSNVSFIEAGQFEGWMSPAATLSLVAQFDDDGTPTMRTIEAACSATAGLDVGLED